MSEKSHRTQQFNFVLRYIQYQKLLSQYKVKKIIIDEIYTFYDHLYLYDDKGKKLRKRNRSYLFNAIIILKSIPVCLYVLKYFISNKPINQQYLDKVTAQIKKQFSSNDEIVLKGSENYNEDIKQVMRKVLKVQTGKEQKQIISYQDIKDLYKIYSNKFKQVENDFNKKYEIEKQSKLIHKCLDDF